MSSFSPPLSPLYFLVLEGGNSIGVLREKKSQLSFAWLGIVVCIHSGAFDIEYSSRRGGCVENIQEHICFLGGKNVLLTDRKTFFNFSSLDIEAKKDTFSFSVLI